MLAKSINTTSLSNEAQALLNELCRESAVHPLYPSIETTFEVLSKEVPVIMDDPRSADWQELELDVGLHISQSFIIRATTTSGTGRTYSRDCRYTFSGQEFSDGPSHNMQLEIEGVDSSELFGDKLRLEKMKLDRLRAHIVSSEACSAAVALQDDRREDFQQLADAIYPLSEIAPILHASFNHEIGKTVVSPDSIRKVLLEGLAVIKDGISRCTEQNLSAEVVSGVTPLKQYVDTLESFIKSRPIETVLPSLQHMNERLWSAYQFYVVRGLLTDDEAKGLELKAHAESFVVELRDEFLLNQFSAATMALCQASHADSFDSARVLEILESPQITEYPGHKFAFLGEPAISEMASITSHLARKVRDAVIANNKREGPVEEIEPLVSAYASVLLEYAGWWKLHSMWHVVPDENHPNTDLAYRNRELIGVVRQEDSKTLTDECNSIALKLKARNALFGLTGSYTVAAYGYPSLEDEGHHRSIEGRDFSLSLMKVLPGIVAATDNLERANLYSQEKRVGISHPTGREYMSSLIENHGAQIYGGFTENATLGGFCAVLPDEERFPEEYKARVLMLKELKIIPHNARSLWGEIIIVDEMIKPSFKEVGKLGSVELFSAVWRHEVGRKVWNERMGHSELSDDSSMWLVGMVGVKNERAILRYESDGWIIPKTPESVAQEHGSSYYLMAKPFSSGAFRVQI